MTLLEISTVTSRRGRRIAAPVLTAFAAALLTAASGASGQRIVRGEVVETPAPPPPASSAMRNTRPLPELIARLRALPGYRSMDYIGVERFEADTSTYVLRFLNGRQIVTVHMDARTGRVLRRTP
jgi:hypothetical protein